MISKIRMISIILWIGVIPSIADIIYFDYRPPEPSVFDSVSGGRNSGAKTGGVFLSTSGASEASGELKIKLNTNSRGNRYSATVTLANGIATAAEGDVVDATTLFPSSTLLISGNAIYNGFTAVRFKEGIDFYYGWVEIETRVTASRNSVSAKASILQMAFNNTVNESIIVGAIPEPSVLLLILTGGSIAFVGHRWRTRARQEENT